MDLISIRRMEYKQMELLSQRTIFLYSLSIMFLWVLALTVLIVSMMREELELLKLLGKTQGKQKRISINSFLIILFLLLLLLYIGLIIASWIFFSAGLNIFNPLE